MYSGLEFLEDLLTQARRMDWKNHPPEGPVKSHDVPCVPLPEEFRGLYVILCDHREISNKNLRRGESLLVRGGGAATIPLSRHVVIGCGRLVRDAEGVESLFWWLVCRSTPELWDKDPNDLAVREGWMVVESNDPTGY